MSELTWQSTATQYIYKPQGLSLLINIHRACARTRWWFSQFEHLQQRER